MRKPFASADKADAALSCYGLKLFALMESSMVQTAGRASGKVDKRFSLRSFGISANVSAQFSNQKSISVLLCKTKLYLPENWCSNRLELD